MHRLLLATAFLAVAAPVAGSARQVALVGLVRDSSTRLALPGAIVSIPQEDLSTVSQADGSFRLTGITSGEHTVFIRHDEYEPWAVRIRITLEDERDIPLGVVRMAPAHRAIYLGAVVDSVSGAAIQNASVTIDGLNLSEVTDVDGHFVMRGVRSGEHTLRVRSVGYDTWALTVNLEVPQPMRVNFGRIPLQPSEAVTLDEIVVEGEPFSASLMMRDFMTRMRTEQGTFLTYEDIERLDPYNTSDIFRSIGGMNALRNGTITSGRGQGSLQGFGPCMVQYYLDGVKVTAHTIDVILPTVIAGIEIYRGSSTIPPIFRSQKNANCGVIAVWRKDGSHGRGSD